MLFHVPDDCGEILLASGCGLRGVDRCRSFRSRHPEFETRRFAQDQREILLHEAYGKLRRVVRPLCARQLSNMRLGDDRGFRECVKQQIG